MSHTFGNMNRDREKRIAENKIKRQQAQELKNRTQDEKMKDAEYRKEFMIHDLKNKICACKWDIDHGFKNKQQELEEYEKKLAELTK